MSDTTIGVSDEVKNRLEPVKEEWGARSWDDFMNDLVEENVDVDPEELDEVTVEKREQVEQTRATVAGVLEALDEANMVDEAVDIIKELSQQRMLAEHRRIVDHLIEKSKTGGEVNEVDRLLARMVIETEGTRDQETPAAEIARGLFDGSTTAERTTKQKVSSSGDQSGTDEESSHNQDESTIDSQISVSNGRMEEHDEEL